MISTLPSIVLISVNKDEYNESQVLMMVHCDTYSQPRI